MEIEKVKEERKEIITLKPEISSPTEKLRKKEFEHAIETLERLSLIISKVDKESIAFASVPDDVLQKRLPAIFKQNVELGNIVENYLKDKKNFNTVIKEMFKGTIAEKEFGEIRNFKDLLKAYLKIMENESFMALLKKIEEERPDLLDLIKSFDLITLYFFIKKILPLLIASGFSLNIIEKICKYLIKMSLGGRAINMRRILLFLPKLREFMYAFGTPDGKALLLFLEGEPWE